MDDQPKRTSKFLVLFSFLMCAGAGVVFTQSSASAPISTEEITGILASAEIAAETQTASAKDAADEDSEAGIPENEDTSVSENQAPEQTEEAVSPEATMAEEASSAPTETALPTEHYYSPEALLGTWSCEASNWYFTVNGSYYTGFLYDTDGHVYYFYEDGRMLTDIQQIDGATYYFDLDGIMQYGDIDVNGQILHFGDDGKLV